MSGRDDLPRVLLPWMEPVQQEIRRMVVKQRDVDRLRSLGIRCDRRNAPIAHVLETAGARPMLWHFTEALELPQ